MEVLLELGMSTEVGLSSLLLFATVGLKMPGDAGQCKLQELHPSKASRNDCASLENFHYFTLLVHTH